MFLFIYLFQNDQLIEKGCILNQCSLDIIKELPLSREEVAWNDQPRLHATNCFK